MFNLLLVSNASLGTLILRNIRYCMIYLFFRNSFDIYIFLQAIEINI